VNSIQIEEKQASDNTLKGCRILVVDDNEINQLIAREVLNKAGCVISVVENGQAALDIAEKQPFDIILMDIQMPVMDGETATRNLKNNADLQHIPVIAMTANVMTQDVENYFDIGFSGFIGKPFIPEDMLKEISSQLSKQSLPK